MLNNECEIVIFFTGHSVWRTKVIHQTESTFTRPKGNHNFFLIFHCWWLVCIVSFTCIKPFSLLLILIRVVFLFRIPMSCETNKKKNGMGTQIFITIYIPNSFIVNIFSPREGKRFSSSSIKSTQKSSFSWSVSHIIFSAWRSLSSLSISSFSCSDSFQARATNFPFLVLAMQINYIYIFLNIVW